MAVGPGPWPFVRLKLRLMANGMRGRPGRIALFATGLFFAGLFAVIGYGVFAIPGVAGDPRAAGMLLTLGGAAILLGWLLLPLVLFGVDESLDPARFALLPLRRRTLLAGLFAGALVGTPAVATLVATAGMVDTSARLGGPGAALAQVAGVLLGLGLCVAISRSVTSAFAAGLRSRRSRELAVVLLAVLAAMIGPLQLAAQATVRRADWDVVERVAAVVAWTPFGAPYSLGLDVAQGRSWAVPVKVVMILLVGGGLLAWWASTSERAMAGAGVSSAPGRAGAAGAPVATLLGRLPRTRFGALVARELRYQWRETRRRASLITFAMVGVFLPIALSTGDVPSGPALMMVGAIAAVASANQFGFDGGAYAMNMIAGVPGRAEIGSRAAAQALVVVPVLVVVAVVAGVVGGEPGMIPARLGQLIATYGVGLGLVLPLSVRAAYALPQSSSPFAMSSGGGSAKGMLTFAVMAGTVVIALPLTIIGWALGDVWPWIGLPVGVAYAAAAYLIGAGVAGDWLDRRQPELLATVTART